MGGRVFAEEPCLFSSNVLVDTHTHKHKYNTNTHTHTHTHTRTLEHSNTRTLEHGKSFCNIRAFIADKLGAAFKPSSCHPLWEDHLRRIFFRLVERWISWMLSKDDLHGLSQNVLTSLQRFKKSPKKPCPSRLKWWKRYLILDGLEWYYSYRFLGPGFYCIFIFRKCIYFIYIYIFIKWYLSLFVHIHDLSGSTNWFRRPFGLSRIKPICVIWDAPHQVHQVPLTSEGS